MPLSNLGQPKALNLTIVRGDSFSRPITMTENGSPVSLVGYEARGQIRDKVNGSVKANFVFDYTDLVNGMFTMKLDTAATRGLPANGVWDLEIFLTADPLNNTHTIMRGDTVTIDDVARALAP